MEDVALNSALASRRMLNSAQNSKHTLKIPIVNGQYSASRENVDNARVAEIA
jgi:hypothetical protein